MQAFYACYFANLHKWHRAWFPPNKNISPMAFLPIRILLLPEPKLLFFAHFAPNHHLCYTLYNCMVSVNFCLLFYRKLITACDLGNMPFNINKTGYVSAAPVKNKYKRANLALLTAPNIVSVPSCAAGRWPNGRALLFGTVVCGFDSRFRHGCL